MSLGNVLNCSVEDYFKNLDILINFIKFDKKQIDSFDFKATLKAMRVFNFKKIPACKKLLNKKIITHDYLLNNNSLKIKKEFATFKKAVKECLQQKCFIKTHFKKKDAHV